MHIYISWECDCKIWIIYNFLQPQKNWNWSVAAILNFSKTLKKSPVHLHMVGNVIAEFE